MIGGEDDLHLYINDYEYEDYEVVLPMLLYNQFKCVEHLGVTQDIAVWKDQSKI